MKNIEIVFDNGGGITLQKTDTPYYIHYYGNPAQLADDIRAIIDGNGPEEWDGNQYEELMEDQRRIYREEGDDLDDLEDSAALIDVTDEDERNGGYRLYRLDILLDEITSGNLDNTSWYNIDALVTALKYTGGMKMKTVYEQINDAKNTNELSDVVENFLDSIGQNNKSESYEECAERLRLQDMEDNAEIMGYAAAKWHKIEQGR
jgi:hypothetical protein